jgi:hypothetical protein
MRDHLIAKAPTGDGHREHHEVVGEVRRLVDFAEALHTLRTTRDPTQTDAAHQKRVLTAAVKFAKEAETALARMNKSWATGHLNIDARIAAKVNLKPDAYAAEVRDLYRRMSSAEKAKFFTELVDEGRGAELAAIVKAPKAVTGMPDDQRQKYEAAFVARHAPEEVREQEALKDAFDTALVVHREARGLATAYSDSAKLAEIERAENAATAAQARIDAQVHP